MIPPADFKEKLKKKKKGEDGIYSTAYYSLGGLLVGMFVADIWDKLGLPGNKKKLENALLTGTPINKSVYDEDKLYQNILAGLVMSLELLGIKGGVASGAGMLIGFNYVNATKKGDYIGGLPSP